MISFHIHYKTEFGDRLAMLFGEDGSTQRIITMESNNGADWFYHHKPISKTTESLYYKYTILNNDGVKSKEWGPNRSIALDPKIDTLVEDKWRPRDIVANSFLSSAFTQAIYKRNTLSPIKKVSSKERVFTFELTSSIISSTESFGIVGNGDLLGNWEKPIMMSDERFPYWSISIPSSYLPDYLEYKYVKINPKTREILAWEDGENRIYRLFQPSKHIIIKDDHFRTKDYWRGSGVAIPIFSLRSSKSLGIGEFLDLDPLIDWTADIGMNIIQVLPINDTIANKTWVDSYPYAAISVMALHPLYVNIDAMGKFKSTSVDKEYKADVTKLNALENIDFEAVLDRKFHYFRVLYNDHKLQIHTDKEIHAFIDSQSNWIIAYAAFCVLRDKYDTCQYGQWPELSVYDANLVNSMMKSGHHDFDDMMFYIWIQFHADKQLLSMRDKARQYGISLKGDLPIGIYRHSCDAWIAPELYNMEQQAGAPPDDYAELGQNWGFPTYNWEVMRQDGYAWWRSRMRQLNRYFDALRIDHILGFFRIWQIPTNQVQGTMGTFNPRLPYNRDELARYGILGDLSRYVEPWITYDMLVKNFGDKKDEVISTFLDDKNLGLFHFKKEFPNQKHISDYVSKNNEWKVFELSLHNLMSNVILIAEQDGHHFNPRITVNTTQSYLDLEPWQRDAVMKLYNYYYFSRHDEFWKTQAMERLPAVLDASDMLICGEDLGMIPATVPGVMKDLNIMSLEIQRMPKGNSKWGITKEYPYASVCSPSCHDMSTIRGWWESDTELSRSFYYEYLHQKGLAPTHCSQDIVRSIVWDHINSPSMLAIFPIQDLVGMHEDIRKEDADSEQINVPANPKHYWRYRFHINIEKLMEYQPLIENVRAMLAHSGRVS